ncbi:MAG: hypothetical protein ACRDPD_09290 [Streptosporangiaceae bacterium]
MWRWRCISLTRGIEELGERLGEDQVMLGRLARADDEDDEL